MAQSVARDPEQGNTVLVRQAIQAAIDVAQASGLEDVARDLGAILMDLSMENESGPVH
jgi:hypothetical protein